MVRVHSEDSESSKHSEPEKYMKASEFPPFHKISRTSRSTKGVLNTFVFPLSYCVYCPRSGEQGALPLDPAPCGVHFPLRGAFSPAGCLFPSGVPFPLLVLSFQIVRGPSFRSQK